MNTRIFLNTRRRRFAFRRQLTGRPAPATAVPNEEAAATLHPRYHLEPTPSLELLRQVKAGFILQNTTMTRWARENGTYLSNVRNALTGSWDGPRGRAMRQRVVRAARIEALS